MPKFIQIDYFNHLVPESINEAIIRFETFLSTLSLEHIQCAHKIILDEIF